MVSITSVNNPKIKEALKLWKRRERDRTGCFLIEGYRELCRALQAKLQWHTLFICPQLFLGSNEHDLIETISKQGVQVYTCSESVFQKLSYRDRPDGLLAIAQQFQYSFQNMPVSDAPFFVVAEAIEKPGNLGTILRSSDAVRVDGVIVCDQCTDIFNPNVVRASVGTLFTQPVITSDSQAAFEWLKKNQISILAATPSAEVHYTSVDLKQPVAIVVGTEQYGLSSYWMENADFQVKIPMLGSADSLNVAMATTLLLYEAVRQRQNG